MQSHTHKGIIQGEAGGQENKVTDGKGQWGADGVGLSLMVARLDQQAYKQQQHKQFKNKKTLKLCVCMPFSYSSNHLLCCCDLFKVNEL